MIVAVDLETTGVESRKDKIIEIGLIKFNPTTFEVVDTFTTFINPWIPIPEIISNITNIFDSDVREAPFLDRDMCQKVADFIGEAPLLAHNTQFDREFLMAAGIDIQDNLVLDTFHLSNIFFHEEKSLNLGNLCESFWIGLTQAHRALADTQACMELFAHITHVIHQLSPEKKQILSYVFSLSSDKAYEYYGTFFKLPTAPTFEEFIKIITELRKLHLIPQIHAPKETKDKKNKWLKETFEHLPHAEFRANQMKMALMIEASLLSWKKLLIEAPTWVGKTFAYLVPSILFSHQYKEPIIVSTHTKALQDQIYYKDLHFLADNMEIPFLYTKLKGKMNYFSFFRFFELIDNMGTVGREETTFLAKMAIWSIGSDFCETDELGYYGKEYHLLKEVNADHISVFADHNPYRNIEPLLVARQLAGNADIVVVNHSLLIQDRVSKAPLFPKSAHFVIDEAHNLEDTLSEALRKRTSIETLSETLDRMVSQLKKQNSLPDNLDQRFEKFLSGVSLIFDVLTSYTLPKNSWDNDSIEILIKEDFLIENPEIKKIIQDLQIISTEIFNALTLLDDKVTSKIKTEISILEEASEILSLSLQEKALEKYIPIFSYSKTGENYLSYTLLNLGDFLKHTFWKEASSVILTSATLQINNRFDFVINLYGLDEEFELTKLESDFDYSKQALLFLPQDLGSVKYNNPKITQFLDDFFSIVKGNSLALFTSFRAIKDTYLALNITLKKEKITLLAQWIGGSKHKILNHFKKHANNSIILGTSTFWEGIDLPWNDLQYLIIHKFPFDVPTDPIFEARCRLFQDPFGEYSIPRAILKTKQWFWRLIRTKTDTWVVILLDERVFSSSYGEIMKTAFPSDINIKTGTSWSFLKLIQKKYQKND